ncbi:AbiV family abortive infection protein [Actinacidiphila bryophytorum]|uniref:AbiV family abortive infection protein n=1 Tax=Actinacidiphila bryophytorum TaxID=1436133 RepID=UPI002176AE6F|nr:AbiV family abortive infection protein [Actinacidiphila bryophytorum]UWE10214.1 AbiV family abortive infection protein [Actinacidiphila bryophytorum]
MAKLLPTDPQDLERAVLELTAASFRNARKLQQAAVALLDQELWPGALAWAALAAEEVGKAGLCISLLTTPRALREPAIAEFNRGFNHHQTKASIAHLLLAMDAEELPASWEQLIDGVTEAARTTHRMKMRGLYVDYTPDTGALLAPEDIGEDAARFMVATVDRLLAASLPAEASISDPDNYLDFLHQWHEGMDFEALQERFEADPMAFLGEIHAMAHDDVPPSAAWFGERLAEQMAAASRAELSPAPPAPAAPE